MDVVLQYGYGYGVADSRHDQVIQGYRMFVESHVIGQLFQVQPQVRVFEV